MATISNIPKKYIAAGVIAVVALLILVNIFQPSNFLYKDKTDYEKQQQLAAKERQEYADYLASIKPDPDASSKLFSEVIDPKEVEKEIAAELDVDQKVVIPAIDDSKLAIQPRANKDQVSNYFLTMNDLMGDLRAQVDPAAKSAFSSGATVAGYKPSYEAASKFIDAMYKLPVPQEAVLFHKAELAEAENIRGLIGQAQNYAMDSGVKPWPSVYAAYVVMSDRQPVVETEFKKLDNKYQIAQLSRPVSPLVKLGLVKEAQAQFAVADIPQTVRYVADQLLGTAFANFYTTFLPAFIDKIESSYKISNFLYYTDALVTGQYLNDYLSKYVPNSLDQSLIKRFIPQISCAGNQGDLQPIFQAKAKEFFNPSDINPLNADFYEQLGNKAGNVSFSTPFGQETLFKQYASGALGQSYDAALTELLNQNGLKVPRTLAGKAIETTIGSLAGTLQSSITTQLNIGSYDPNSIVSKIASQGLTAFEQKFVFKGVVLKEQDTCISYPQLQPVIPGSLPKY